MRGRDVQWSETNRHVRGTRMMQGPGSEASGNLVKWLRLAVTMLNSACPMTRHEGHVELPGLTLPRIRQG
jgi:hypothetical protein